MKSAVASRKEKKKKIKPKTLPSQMRIIQVK